MKQLYLAGICSVLVLLTSAFSAFPSDKTDFFSPAPPQAGPDDTTLCPPLFTPESATVSNITQLLQAVDNASPGVTIRLADGTYTFDGNDRLRMDVNNVTLRSASGNRNAVILDGNYQEDEIIEISASNVTIADLTIEEASDHPIHVVTDGDDTLNTRIYNVHIKNPGQQAIKINPGLSGGYPDNGTIACSHIELTGSGRPHIRDNCYTGGIDAHQARNWTIRDNLIEGFWCASGLSEHGIHMWRGCRDTKVERNELNNNARGIGFGLETSGSGRTYPDNPCPDASGYVDDFGGIIRNNFVFANDPDLFASNDGFDAGIALWNSCNSRVLHNTVYTNNPDRTFSAIEWRFDNTQIDLINNLANDTLRDRGGNATQVNNISNAQNTWFVDTATGDLHLVSTATTAIDQVTAPADVTDDFDGDSRPIGSASDIGADEYGIPAPAAVTDLRVTQAVTGTGSVTITLRWAPPTNALTTTIRYTVTPITESNWSSATELTSTLPGSTDIYTATIPYGGGTLYFALKAEGEGGVSGLSNIAFWPSTDVYLPIIIK